MTAEEFARLLDGRRVGRGKWIARCPAHADSHPSLSITTGRKVDVVFRCMSQGCTANEILAAMGLRWRDLLGRRPQMSREARSRLADERALHSLRDIRRLMAIDTYLSFPEMGVSQRQVEGWDAITRQIRDIEERLNPKLKEIRLRGEKTYRFVKKWGWDKLWNLYLERSNAL